MAASASRRARSSSRCRRTSFRTISRPSICRAELCRLARAHLRACGNGKSIKSRPPMPRRSYTVSLVLLAAAVTACGEATSPVPAIQPTITAGTAHTCMLSSTGTVSCWGGNFAGQLGNGSTTGSVSPVIVAASFEFTTISARASYTCGLDRAGAAFCWGNNGFGMLGNGTTAKSTVPGPVSGGLHFSSLTTGSYHACGVTSNGAAYCWGWNTQGQLGTSDTGQRLVPTPVVGGLSFKALAAGYDNTCGITTSGQVYCWGGNIYGQLGTVTRTTPNYAPLAVSGGQTFTAIASGSGFSCALGSSGATFCWGANNVGESRNLSGCGYTTPTQDLGSHVFSDVTAA